MSAFANKLIAWQKQYGRHDLPWQQTRDPYAIWVSEIMLQQTQVSAVIGYYSRFMARFPTVQALAQASLDEVLQSWSGLGYYSRARNLHHAANTIMETFHGDFPSDVTTLQTLKGIGRSTAAAIAVFAFNHRETILDGNVKRVLARLYGIHGWPGTPEIEKQLWALAESLLPTQALPSYVQGLMDFGATLCTRSRPACADCPMQSECRAWQTQQVTQLPTPKPRKALPEKSVMLLLLMYGHEILLEKRPNQGIWGGLWSFPEAPVTAIASEFAQSVLALSTEPQETWPVLWHTFTHFKLAITPQPLTLVAKPPTLPPQYQWIAIADASEAAIPTPIRTLLNMLNTRMHSASH